MSAIDQYPPVGSLNMRNVHPISRADDFFDTLLVEHD